MADADPGGDESVAVQRARQASWRPWAPMLDRIEPLLPPRADGRARVALDLGCGTGEVLRLLADRGWTAVGVDADEEMLRAARPLCGSCRVERMDLTTVCAATLPLDPAPDLIWSSFTVQYFMPQLPALLPLWAQLLGPGGLIALVEIDGLFSCHEPQPDDGAGAFRAMEEALGEAGYDCFAGRRVEALLRDCGLEIVECSGWDDVEFSFAGAAPAAILRAWEQRFARMKFPVQYFGPAVLEERKRGFLECLASAHHRSTSQLRLVVGRKPAT